jgi:hypothetical protein
MTFSTDLNVLHDDVVRRSKEEGQQGYRAKLLQGYNFVLQFPADTIDLPFNEVLHANIFYVSALSPELMRLWARHRASDPLLGHSKVSLLDPFYMHYHNLESVISQELISNYLFSCMISTHPQKDTFLLPYCDK